MDLDFTFFIQTMGLLGLRLRYWLIIIIVVLIILALGYYARGRAA